MNAVSLSRLVAVMAKEFVQMRRDRLTFGMMVGIPVLQLLLFGFAINSDPKHLPAAVHLEEESPYARGILSALENSQYFVFVRRISSAAEGDRLLAAGEVAFVVTVPAGFAAALLRGDRPQLLVEADASDPSASSNALAVLPTLATTALRRELETTLAPLGPAPPAVDIVIHRAYNPEGISAYNVVPGLLGVILTMTMVLITSLAVTREVERGTMENLLAMPLRPSEVMIGKITPYVLVGYIQAVIVLIAGRVVFDVPMLGSLALLSAALALFILANLAVGFTFSTLARSQLQAMQMTFFFFLPSILLSGFMFPFRGMPDWAQWIGEMLPLTHFLRIVRGVMLKGAGPLEILHSLWPLALFMVVVSAIALRRYRRTLD